MRVPLSWLNEFVDLSDQTAQGVADTRASRWMGISWWVR